MSLSIRSRFPSNKSCDWHTTFCLVSKKHKQKPAKDILKVLQQTSPGKERKCWTTYQLLLGLKAVSQSDGSCFSRFDNLESGTWCLKNHASDTPEITTQGRELTHVPNVHDNRRRREVTATIAIAGFSFQFSADALYVCVGLMVKWPLQHKYQQNR